MSDDDKPYYIAIGRSYAEGNRIISDFTRYYFALLPLVIASAGVLGWFMAGRALAAGERTWRTPLSESPGRT